MRAFKRKYRSKGQQAALAAFWFGGVFIIIVSFIIYSATLPSFKGPDKATHQDVIISEALSRMN